VILMADGLALTVDFGSTFTKLRAVDLGAGTLVATAQSPTTVAEGLDVGLFRGLDLLGVDPGMLTVRLGCSSAAGGLRIVAIGLVRSLTAEAARLAALGAGGKIVATYAGVLTSSDLEAIAGIAPDLIVLAGGTDGGDRRCIAANARSLAASRLACPVIVAGNRSARDDVADAIQSAAAEWIVVDNVLPSLDVLAPEGCSAAIRDTFIRCIARAKGLADAEEFLGCGIIPTPNAVLQGITLLAEGTRASAGLGELLSIDVGGATTDVYSVSDGEPTTPRTTMRGLPEPHVKRTVEGDLGVRINAQSIVAAAETDELARSRADRASARPLAGTAEYARQVTAAVATLPSGSAELSFDERLAATAALIAARRHAGRLEQAFGPVGRYYVQRGKDLTAVRAVVGSGGVLSGTARPLAAGARILAPVTYDEAAPEHLLPCDAARYIDRDYVLFAAGLLSADYPEQGRELLRASCVIVG
jgi:uncharacterized protein (TIGR01319 family)